MLLTEENYHLLNKYSPYFLGMVFLRLFQWWHTEMSMWLDTNHRSSSQESVEIQIIYWKWNHVSFFPPLLVRKEQVSKSLDVFTLACFIWGSVTREEPVCSLVDNVYFTLFYFIFRLVDILITIFDLAWAPCLLSEMN